MSPELCQELALNLDVLDIFGILRRLNGRNLLIERNGVDRIAAWIEPHLFRSAKQIARRAIPVLSLTAVHRQLHGMAVFQMKRFVLVQ